MNGARTIFRRKGYLLTALAAAVLLAASSGTAWAQVTAVTAYGEDGVRVSAPVTVNEGNTATISVSVRGQVAAAASAETEIEVTITAAGTPVNIPGGARGSSAESDDFEFFPSGVIMFTFPVGTGANKTYTYTKSVELDTHTDRDAENEGVSLTVAVGAPFDNPDLKYLVIVDPETQDYDLALTRRQTPSEGGGTFTVDLEANPPHVDDGIDLVLQVVKDGARDRSYSVTDDTEVAGLRIGDTNPVSATNTNGDEDPDGDPDDNEAVLTIETPEIDGNRVTDTVTLEAYGGSAGDSRLIASLDIDVADIHGLPAADAITAEAMDEDGEEVTEIVEGGDPVYLTITVDRGDGLTAKTVEELVVDIKAANAAQGADYELSRTRVTLEEVPVADGEQSTEVEIMLSARSDEDVGTENLVLNLVVAGSDPDVGPETSMGTFTITIVDETMKKVEPKSEDEAYPAILGAMETGAGDEGFNPGESFSVMTSDLFTVMDGYTASYKAAVSGDAVSVSASSETVTVDAKMASENPAKVTITATAEMGASSFLPEQAVADEASITFEVMVVDKPLVVTLEMPANVMDGNIVEGESYDIMVSANRMVMEDTEVMIMRDRSGSDAGDDDFSVSMATIMAGYDSATAELMVTEDMMPDSGTNDNMGEMLVLYGMVGDMETNSLTFTIWDQAVPALPLFGQLLLALFLMLGGARLYRRRQG